MVRPVLTFSAIKEFANHLWIGNTIKNTLVFPAPYDDVLKSDSISEVFWFEGCYALANWLRSHYEYLIPHTSLEMMTFSHLLDLVNGAKTPGVFDPATHFQPEDLQPGEALSTFEVHPLDRKHVDGVVVNNGPQIVDEPEWLDGGHANPLWCKDYLNAKGRAIMMEKNHDYRGGSGDPYANFRGSRFIGIHPITGILLRVQDKMMRIKTFVEKGELKVQDEGIEDALVDVQNYMDLIYGLIKEEKNAS
jgi:hypothetical protein